MKKNYTIAGVGVCLGKKPGFEVLAQSVLSGTPVAGKEREDSLTLAVREALQFTSGKTFDILTDTKIEKEHQSELNLGEQKICAGFREMLEAASENALLLSSRENGWLAIALTQDSAGLAQVEITDDGEENIGDSFLDFVISALELRYSLHLDARDSMYRFWDAAKVRSKELCCEGMKCVFREPAIPAKRVYSAKKYVLPVVFTTEQEAVQKLKNLKQKAQNGLKNAMEEQLLDLDCRNEYTNTIVLLADSFGTLEADIEDLLEKSGQLLQAGFAWKRVSGSRYICRSCTDPKIVFMNPPASMFNAKTFYNFFFTVYGTLSEIDHFETDKLLTGDKDIFLSDYLFDIVVNYCVTKLLEGIGIRPDIMSGASMGELANLLQNMRYTDGSPANTAEVMSHIEDALKFLTRSDDEPLNEYLGRKTDGFTKFYVKGDAEVICREAEKYDGVFVMIIGSTEDVILTGERSAIRKLIADTGCVANELNVANYIHTPVASHLEESIRKGVLEANVHLEPMDYVMFSTHFLKPMDSTQEMLAENKAALLTKTVDYAAAVKALYENGGRVFIDLSTTQMCGTWAAATTKNKFDAQVASLYSGGEEWEILLNLCAILLASNVRFDAQKLLCKCVFLQDAPENKIVVKKEENVMKQTSVQTEKAVSTPVSGTAMSGDEFAQVLNRQLMNNRQAFRLFMDAQNRLYEQMLGSSVSTVPVKAPAAVSVEVPDAGSAEAPAVVSADAPAVKFPDASTNYLFDRQQVLTMTDTSMAAVLGEQYKEVDQYPVRARMPLPPFMFVSRIISIDAEFGVFRPSSIVSEFDLDEDCVFRASDHHICPLIASEASHVAIFLIAYMGLDAISKGTLSYRAIDSAMTAYSERPFRVGDTLRTVLKINRFVKNGSTTLLFFTFESYNGDELIAITEATGGFFTKADLTSNKGIIRPRMQLRSKLEPKEFIHFSDTTRTTYEKEELEAFYRGDYKACFGVAPKPTQKEVYYLPYDLKMIDRVTKIDYNGGIYGRGIICGEKQITPDMWPFKAHFKNDPVFPAIIVSDGITQLGMFLFAHSGLLSKFDNASFTMIKGNCVNSKFRGQVRHGYSTLRYEVNVREVDEAEDSICVYFDAAIFNDDIQIMQIDSYAMKIANAAD